MSKMLEWRSQYLDKMEQGTNSELFIELIKTWAEETVNVYMWALATKFFVYRLVDSKFLSPQEKEEVQAFLNKYGIVLFDNEN